MDQHMDSILGPPLWRVEDHAATSMVIQSVSRNQGLHSPNTQRTAAATKFFKKRCLLCGENFHVNNNCPRAGSITEALTNCGVCEAYFDYTNTAPHKAQHNLTWNGSVRADTCPYLKRRKQTLKSSFLREIGCCTVCLARTKHRPEECPVRTKIKHYLCNKPGCNSQERVCPDFQGHNEPQVSKPRQPNLLNLGEYLPQTDVSKEKSTNTSRKPLFPRLKQPPIEKQQIADMNALDSAALDSAIEAYVSDAWVPATKWPVLGKTILNNRVSSERMTDQISSAALQPAMPSTGRLYARKNTPSLQGSHFFSPPSNHRS